MRGADTTHEFKNTLCTQLVSLCPLFVSLCLVLVCGVGMPTYLSRHGICLHTLPMWAPQVSTTPSSLHNSQYTAPSSLPLLSIGTHKKSLCFLLTLAFCFSPTDWELPKDMNCLEHLVNRKISQFLTHFWHLISIH